MIDENWLRPRLAGHGKKAEFARHLGVGSHVVSKLLSGVRRIQPHELPLVYEFFGIPFPGHNAPPGLSDSDVVPFQGALRDDVIRLAWRIAPNLVHPMLYQVRTNHVAFGILSGDVLITDMQATPGAGDIVVVNLVDPDVPQSEDGPTREAVATTLRRYNPPWLIPSDPTIPATDYSDDSEWARIAGVVRGSMRGPGIGPEGIAA